MRCSIVLSVLVVSACGSGTPSADQDFCDYISSIDEMDAEANPQEALATFDETIRRAPNKDVREALQQLREVFEKLTTIDPNDEEGITEMMSLMFDPKIVAAGEVLDAYSKDVCGIESDASTGFGSDSSTDFGSSTGSDETSAP